MLYRLDPNYIRKTWYDTNQRSDANPHGKIITVKDGIRVPKGHHYWIPNEIHVVTFIGWVPQGGPMWGVRTNVLIESGQDIRQRGIIQQDYTEAE